MQLKGLVRFFTVALVLICIYQLSFTWMVHSHENKMDKKASAWVKANYATPEQKYAGNLEQQKLYADSLEVIQKAQVRQLLDSTRNAKVGPFGMTTYQKAKNSELMLGLDLQGGMSVTMEVGLDGLVHALSNYSKDPSVNAAIDQAKAIKANDNTDYISLFAEQWKKVNNGKKLAPFFAQKSNKELTYESTDDQVILYLRKQAKAAFTNTYKILRTRIDRFGLSSPTINPDEAKGIITIELAGVNDAERVRHYLQSTANLQFFEVYNIQEIGADFQKVDGLLSKAGVSTESKDTTTATTAKAAAPAAAAANAKADTGNTSLSALEKTASDTNATFADKGKTANGTVDSAKLIREKYPFSSMFLDIARPYQDEQGQVSYPSYIGMVSKSDTAKLNKVLQSDIVKSAFPANLVFMYGKADEKDPKMNGVLQLFAIKTLDNGQARLEGDHITDASQGNNQMGQVTVNMKMDESGARIWADMTKKNAGKPIAIVLDNIVYSAPMVHGEISGGSSEITGSYTVAEAQDMANILESGKLPAPAKIVQEQIVGPTLGQAAVSGGLISFGLSFVIIFALMLLYFNTAGWIANIALTLNLLFTIGVLCSLGFTLTAPGIAALVLTVGMAVDTNVIIFERIKEELVRGKGYLHAVEDGYKRSYAPVLDAHVTTLLTACILFYFGLGPVLGFATTQIIGILLSLFCGILVSRLVSDIYTNKQRHFVYFTKISKKVFAHRAIPFVKYRKVAYIISIFVVILGVATFFYGFNEGVEFSGGRSYTVKFEKAPDQDKVRDDLKAIFKDAPIIKTVNVPEQLNITTSYLIHETGQNVDAKVEQELFKGLQPYLPKATTLNSFKKDFIQSSQTVLPTISKDLKAGATRATIFAIIAICIYIFIRFRDWRFSLGTIVSLLHDVLVTLIVFSFLRNVVPFPLEIDQHFIAAVLTVIGFSMNDTVIVYDRIREDAGILHTLDKETIINKAINETLSRTIMTSLTVFLTILILFIFGGEVVRGFAFAMLIGVITGTYSSIFVAAPILIDFAKDKPLGKVKDHSIMERKHHDKLHGNEAK